MLGTVNLKALLVLIHLICLRIIITILQMKKNEAKGVKKLFKVIQLISNWYLNPDNLASESMLLTTIHNISAVWAALALWFFYHMLKFTLL